MNRSTKLQVFALPSQTVMLFLALILVAIAAVAASSLPGSRMSAAPPLVFILIPLILRDFLMQPDTEIKTHKLHALPADKYPAIIAAIQNSAVKAKFSPPPTLMLTEKIPGALFAFGSFRRAYVGLGERMADRLEQDLNGWNSSFKQAAKAALEHEFQHLHQGDVIAVGLARSTLKIGALFTLWSAFVLLAMAIAISFPLSDIFTEDFANKLRSIDPQMAGIFLGMLTPEIAEQFSRIPANWVLGGIYVLNSHMPIFYTTALLLLTVWRRLLRVREIYADAASANLHQAAAMRTALLRYASIAALSPVNSLGPSLSLNLFSVLPARIQSWKERLTGWFDHHPDLPFREQSLINPGWALGDSKALGQTAGTLMLLIDVMLVSSFTIAYVTEVPGLLSVLVGLAAIAWGLSPLFVVSGQSSWTQIKSILTAVGWALAIRTVFHFLNVALVWFMVIVFPQFALTTFEDYILGTSGNLNNPTHIFSLGDLFGLAAEATAFAVYVAVLIGVTLSAAALADWHLKRLILTWYSAPNTRQTVNRHWWLASIAVTLAVTTLWLPFINSLVPITASFGISLAEVLVGAAAGLVLISWGVFWLRSHRRYSQRCPNCQAQLSGWYFLGKHCDSCGQLLHKWLQVSE